MKIVEVKCGDVLIADAGFTCMDAGPCKVEEDEHGELFVCCRNGRHYLEGQRDDDGSLVGLSRPS